MKNCDLAVIGLGLIGGSLARDARRGGFVRRIYGVESNTVHAKRAMELGLADEILPLPEAVGRADITVVAVPVDTALQVLPAVLDLISPRQTVTDVCSTKRNLVEKVALHPQRSRYVAAHPMAGTEKSGPDAAFSGLFQGKPCVFCDAETSDADAVRLAGKLFEVLGMQIEHMDTEKHDRDVAFLSHLPHVLAYALAAAAMQPSEGSPPLFSLAGGGFSSIARLAKSSASMWAPIFAANRDNLLATLDDFSEQLQAYRTALEEADVEKLCELIKTANAVPYRDQ